MTATEYRPAKSYAAEIRANIKAAQKSRQLDPKWKIRVRTELASMCAEVAVHIQGDAVTDEFLFGNSRTEYGHARYTDEALAVAAQVRELMAPAANWHDGRMHFLFLYWRDGLMA